MHVHTTRFGSVAIQADDILLFPQGLFAFARHRHWVLLADADNDSVGWLQSINDPRIAMAVVSPRRFAPDYRVRVGNKQLSPLQLVDSNRPFVLTLVSQHEAKLTINLRAPVLVNLDRRLGAQVIVSDDQPLRCIVADAPKALRKTG
jgi:flagellar assembly factor FliW